MVNIIIPSGENFIIQGKLLHCIVEKKTYLIPSGETNFEIKDNDVFFIEGLNQLSNVDFVIEKDGIKSISFDATTSDITITGYQVKQPMATAREVSIKMEVSTDEKELDCSYQTVSIAKSVKYSMDFTDYFMLADEKVLSEFTGSLMDINGKTIWKPSTMKYIDFITLVYDGEVDTETIPKKVVVAKEVMANSIEMSVSGGEKKFSCSVKDIAIITL